MIEKITDIQRHRASMETVANRPNDRTGFGSAGLTPAELKARMSALANLAIDKLNEIIGALGDDAEGSALLDALYVAVASEQDDEKRMSLSYWVGRVERLLEERKKTAVTGVRYDAEKEKLTVAFGDGSTEVLDGPRRGLPGLPGADGKDGADGVSPTVTTERVEGGYRITVTAANGQSTFILPDGAKGATGDPFRIAKTYTSVAAMHAGFATDNVPEGGFVLIATGSVEDADNAKLFVKGTEAYQYLIDLSGATGIKGEQGVGVRSITKTGSAGLVDTYTVTLTDGSTSTFTVKNGKDGEDGTDGKDGAPGADGAPGKDGVSPTVTVTETAAGHIVRITDASGTKSFTVKDGADGDGGGSSGSAEVLRNTVLLKARLGYHIDGSSNTSYLVTSAALSDEILPNTTYLINGEAHTSDENGVVSSFASHGGYLEYTLTLSGRTATVNITYDYYSIYDYPIYESDNGRYIDLEVVGPGAFTCLAYLQLNSDQGGDGPNLYHAEPLTVQPVAYRNVYVYSTAYQTVVQTIVLDENGTFPETHILTDPACCTVNLALQNGLAEMTFGFFEGHSDGAICLLTEVDGVTNLSGGTSSGGGATAVYRFDYYSNYNSDCYIPLDPAKIYLITCFESGNYERQLVIERGIVRADYGSCDSIMTCEYYAYSDQLYVTCYGSLLVAVQEIAEYTETTCFMPGTRILLRDPVTKELYEKPIEDVQPFEYAAFWHPGKGRLSATRIVAPPIVGECTEYDRLTFSNGTTVDVYGVQFFWNVDTDRLQNWASMKPGTRVCTSTGDIVEYVGHEHIVSDLPVKHYTLLPFMGRYLANGIQVGDKRELILPRLLQPENKRYWRMLPERDQENLKRAFGSGMRRRNWRYSKEAMEVRQRFRRQREALEGEEKTAQAYLDYTDHEVTKLAEGVITEGEFEPVREERAAARARVKQCRAELAELQPAEEAEIEAVRAAIANTYVPRHAGKFKGKTRCVLEEGET
ncbi:MAG: hypothetical protein E7590_00995 [Ruminococcaceae bacterium]|nr:hypothetical protein [Oscillospiraceae bacterium]